MPFVYHWRVRILISPDWVNVRDITAPATRVRREDIESLRRLRRHRGVLWFLSHDNHSVGVLRDVWAKQQIAELRALLDTAAKTTDEAGNDLDHSRVTLYVPEIVSIQVKRHAGTRGSLRRGGRADLR
jgi:hypothetical protein